MQYSVTLRNNQLNQFEITLGTSPLLRLYTGSKPINCSLAAIGELIAEMILPLDFMSAPLDGIITKSGVWEDLSANAEGTLGYFRMYDASGIECHCQGSITITNAGGEMTVDYTDVLVGQRIEVTYFSIAAGNS
jgi:hypothetical protein